MNIMSATRVIAARAGAWCKPVKPAFYCILITILAGCSAFDGDPLLVSTEQGDSVEQAQITFLEPPIDLRLFNAQKVMITSNQSLSHPTITMLMSELQSAQYFGAPYLSAIEFGRESPLSSALVGHLNVEVQAPLVESRAFTQARAQCPGGDLLQTCSDEESVEYQVQCQGIYAEISATIEVERDVKAAANHDEKPSTILSKMQSETCSDENTLLVSQERLVRDGYRELGIKIAKNFLPNQQERPNNLYSKSESLDAQTAINLRLARNAASKGLVSEALQQQRRILKNMPENGELLFNLGYLHQAKGEYQNAQKFYEKAQAKGVSDQELLLKHLAEVKVYLRQGVVQVLATNPGEALP